ncbi:hypothetical protein [Epilithonimonas sp.]|uniref:hypothetical protein n=1 Tax=Epilithonimonas sp. TaxID=2894511 RepID=UPI00289B19A4|nr:hypothetical protein [Epilithonimonas sp.]
MTKFLKYTVILICITLNSCNQNEYRGIHIGTDLYENQTTTKNNELKEIINEILNKKPSGLIKISTFDCGGGAGCYDLGSVLSQTLNKIGENDFIKMSQHLNYNQKQEINSLLEMGFEYGDNNDDEKMDDTTLSKNYPKLSNELYKK